MSIIRVLIVDDEPRIRRGVERLVRSCGPEWEIAAALADGIEALEYMSGHPGEVDLLITDIKMPEMDGLTLIKEARSRYAISALLLTGYDDFEYVQTALREGAVDYLLKPIDRELFRARLDEVKEKVERERMSRLQWKELSRQAGKLKQTRQKQVLSYITSAQIGSDLSHLGFWVDEFPRGLYLLLYISLDAMPVKTRSYTEKDWQAYYYALGNMIDEIVSGKDWCDSEVCEGWSWRGSGAEFWSLLYRPAAAGPDALDSAAEAVSESIRKAIQTYTPFTVSIAHGDWLEDLYLLPGAKQEAQSLIHYRLLHGGNQRFTPQTAGERGAHENKRDNEIAGLEHKLKQAIGQGRKEEAQELCKALFGAIERMQLPDAIQRAVQSAVVLIHSVGLESCGMPCFPVEEALNAVKRVVTMQDMRRELERLVVASAGQIESVRERDSSHPVEQAKAWIEEHLGGDITIRRIADHVFMNPNYFCQYFKLQTGETILDYVTRRRMEQAAALLRDPGAKLQDISVSVGYQNPKYFSRLFKQWSGQSPSKYREALLAERK
ncbi:response regulator [Paenibacillus doosanensis]|uniref:HTH-type transcriptional regulator YesS n=1 Tax=Paenibacillus konkukensis TaxID=2020716 RepID=A0ABY4RFD4_9BACL|nr:MULTISPECIES: response regulator [Paenibacillus]MCS7460501.1 response regulator [Paenibacillus doosanensis]UQZ81279.1 HTH-type transcriptional regulator YesS [Paenibacillus konkukensis]